MSIGLKDQSSFYWRANVIYETRVILPIKNEILQILEYQYFVKFLRKFLNIYESIQLDAKILTLLKSKFQDMFLKSFAILTIDIYKIFTSDKILYCFNGSQIKQVYFYIFS